MTTGSLRYRSREAATPGDLDAIRALRARAFAAPDADAVPDERDGYDAQCTQVMIEARGSGALAAAFRVMPLPSGARIGASYSGRFYDLTRLAAYPLPMLEVGRFCVNSGHGAPEVLRLAWAVLTEMVDRLGVGMLIGCTSFAGTAPEPYADAFALLGSRHRAPPAFAPRQKADETVALAPGGHDPAAALRQMPPLLRSYLAMGAWVSDHAVIDRTLGTIHVFTGLEVAAIPPGRQRALRALARVIDARETPR